jgi:DNA ligase (NAD+)
MGSKADVLAKRLEAYNESYRAGRPEISDREYDGLVESLRGMDPKHPFLHAVEPEAIKSEKTVRHKVRMLSTEKAYTSDQLERFVERVEKAAASLGRKTLYRVTPKLDGMAGKDEEGVLASRGNGVVGSDITHVFRRGVRAIGGRGKGPGEIVMVSSYFDRNFKEEFDHPRNMVVGIVTADELKESSKKALADGMVHFVPYSEMECWSGTGPKLLEEIGDITAKLDDIDYPLDGMVAEATDSILKEHMGATSHHHRWQIAIKTRGETAETTVVGIQWQTGRTGKLTPVLKVEPTRVSGATISSITAHHAGMVRDKRLGKGARIEIIRSGEVIPKMERVIKPARKTELPEDCPSCGQTLGWQGDFLLCTNHTACPAQTETGLRHWFKTLGNCDGFGPKTIEVLVGGGHTTLEGIYALEESVLQGLGFGDKQSENLVAALEVSRKTMVEDARFLASFGIADLGIGDSRKLLASYRLEDLGGLTEEKIAAIKGFGEKTSKSIGAELAVRWPTIQHMLDLGFLLDRTPTEAEQESIESPIAGVAILFTGKMVQGDRDEMKAQARDLGAKVLSSPSGALQLLVIGERASAGKVSKAKALGAEVLTEAEYLERIGAK